MVNNNTTTKKKTKNDVSSTSLTTEELNQFRHIQTRASELQLQLGRNALDLEFARTLLAERETEREKLFSQFRDLHQTEQAEFSKLEQKYGPGRVDLTSGTFTPITTEQV